MTSQGRINEVCGIRNIIRGVGSDLGSQSRDQESQDIGSGSAVISRDQESGCAIFVGSETPVSHAFGIKNQIFGYKNRINDEKHTMYFVTTLLS